MRDPLHRRMRWLAAASVAILWTLAPPAGADDSVAGTIATGLASSDGAARAKALTELESLVVRDGAAGAPLLPALKEVLHTRPAPERARVARLLLKIPSDEAVALWWVAIDPAREDDDRVLSSGVEAAADRAKDVAFARRLVEHTRDRHETSAHRALALEALGAMEDPASRLLLRTPLPGADWIEESCRALALGRRGGAEAFPPLLELIASERTAVRVAAWESLVKLTGRDLPPRREPWEKWWDAHGNDARHEPASAPTTPSEKDRYTPPDPTHVPRYYGIGLHGRSETYHAVFCLDISASMSTEAIGPARRELTKTIDELTTRHFFDVIAFNEHVTPWAGRQVRAHPVMKAKALAWIEALDPKSYTNIYDAVEKAFEEMGRGRHPSAEPARLDAIFLLSDGAPNRGRWHEPDQVVKGIADLSLRQVPVFTIGVGESVRPVLKAIAEATGGTFTAVFE